MTITANITRPTASDLAAMRKGAALDWFDLPAAERAKWTSRRAFIRARMREARKMH